MRFWRAGWFAHINGVVTLFLVTEFPLIEQKGALWQDMSMMLLNSRGSPQPPTGRHSPHKAADIGYRNHGSMVSKVSQIARTCTII